MFQIESIYHQFGVNGVITPHEYAGNAGRSILRVQLRGNEQHLGLIMMHFTLPIWLQFIVHGMYLGGLPPLEQS